MKILQLVKTLIFNANAQAIEDNVIDNEVEIEESGVTEKVFKSWDSKKQKQYLKDHPTSKYQPTKDSKKSNKKEAPKKTGEVKNKEVKKVKLSDIKKTGVKNKSQSQAIERAIEKLDEKYANTKDKKEKAKIQDKIYELNRLNGAYKKKMKDRQKSKEAPKNTKEKAPVKKPANKKVEKKESAPTKTKLSDFTSVRYNDLSPEKKEKFSAKLEDAQQKLERKVTRLKKAESKLEYKLSWNRDKSKTKELKEELKKARADLLEAEKAFRILDNKYVDVKTQETRKQLAELKPAEKEKFDKLKKDMDANDKFARSFQFNRHAMRAIIQSDKKVAKKLEALLTKNKINPRIYRIIQEEERQKAREEEEQRQKAREEEEKQKQAQTTDTKE